MEDIAQTAENILGIKGFGKKFLNHLHSGFYSLSSPVWSNFGRERGLPISCFGSYIEDTLESITGNKLAEVSMMTKFGGGTSAYFGDLRGRGAEIGQEDSPGIDSISIVVSPGWELEQQTKLNEAGQKVVEIFSQQFGPPAFSGKLEIVNQANDVHAEDYPRTGWATAYTYGDGILYVKEEYPVQEILRITAAEALF